MPGVSAETSTDWLMEPTLRAKLWVAVEAGERKAEAEASWNPEAVAVSWTAPSGSEANW